MKVTVCGAAGGIGQPLSLLFKLSPYVDELSLYDVVNAPGVGADLAHICTKCKVSSYLPANDGLKKSLENSDLVIIPAGIPRKPGMTRDDLFKINAGIIRDLTIGIAETCPNAFVLIISNPVNSTVPIVCEVLKKYNVFNPNKIFGVTNLDIVRSNTFISQLDSTNQSKPEDFNIPVIGGHSGETIVPLFSIGAPQIYSSLSSQQKASLINRVQYAGDEVVKAKDGKGSATLSMAYAGFELAEKIIKLAVQSSSNSTDSSVTACCYINLADSINGAADFKQKLNSDINFFSVPCVLGPNGVTEIDSSILDKINNDESDLIKVSVDQLYPNITKGINFVKNY
ncbi:malate dehydrogenase [Ascoidea rubescens DSM 1968]|uniref:Malate dehydrogenase n=1 Tax=Ascoidea rubescens DSM 1968 TaxID=1344418 RepID=A0A1D2VRP3_9ASCO|nr:malate dehydrogenase mitochondrial precursor [Ascoidea rubescens DSM 1968]ODV64235.1 malate dehydrogenase mitochondrial precursor [Ascoidea rubescens DSM 1968]